MTCACGCGRETSTATGRPAKFYTGHYIRRPRRAALPEIVIDGARVVQVPLTKGKIAIVDAEDGPRVLAYNWCANRCGNKLYATRRLPNAEGGGIVRMHTFLLPPPPGMEVDHVNGDGLDNRRSTNLRVATKQQQQHNRAARGAGRFSRFKGVTKWGGTRWRYHIVTPAGKFSGFADSEIDAARLYNARAREHFGEFARLNAIPEETVTA